MSFILEMKIYFLSERLEFASISFISSFNCPQRPIKVWNACCGSIKRRTVAPSPHGKRKTGNGFVAIFKDLILNEVENLKIKKNLKCIDFISSSLFCKFNYFHFSLMVLSSTIENFFFKFRYMYTVTKNVQEIHIAL